MSEAKKLNPEGLSEALRKVGSGTSTEDTEKALRGHIAALETEVANFKPSGEVGEHMVLLDAVLRDANDSGCAPGPCRCEWHAAVANLAAKAQGYEALTTVCAAIAKIVGFTGPVERLANAVQGSMSLFDKAILEHRTSERERWAAMADNAVLLDGLLRMMSVFEALALEAERSGVAARAGEHRRSAESLRRLHAQPHPGAALLEEHRKALVRARNEGLEKVAGVIGALVAAWHRVKESKAWATASIGEYLEERIRSLKESE